MAHERSNCLNSENSITMNAPIVQSTDGVTLVGGGPVSQAEFRLALARAPRILAADSGADRALAAGHRPEAVVGDFDFDLRSGQGHVWAHPDCSRFANR